MTEQVAFISNRTNQSRIDQTEKELAELEKAAAPKEEAPSEPAEEEKKLTKEEQTFKKRYGDLRRHLAQKEKDSADKIKELETKLSETSAPELPASVEDIGKWREDHPDAAKIVESMAMQIADKRFEEANLDFKALKEGQDKITRDKAEASIRKAHKDFDDLSADDAFHDWVEEQPKWIQNALYENSDDAQSVIRVLDLYKVDAGLTPSAKKQSTKDAAGFVDTRSKAAPDPEEGSQSFSESQVAAMSLTEYEQKEEDINKSIRSGTFNYDVSGAAR